jgi:hypothetical protein
MSVGTADLLEAINKTWDGCELSAPFQALWPSAIDPASFPALHDEEATPDQPFPYCVMQVEKPRVVHRMSGKGVGFKWHVRDVPVTFNIHAQRIEGDVRSSKQIAAYLTEQVMRVFGGHPTAHAKPMELTNGGHLLTQYVSDWSARTDLYKYQWVLNYLMRVDVPVAV